MRIWSLHPHYLDRQGLVALWREALLAKKALRGQTQGYKNHPQLTRFKETMRPVATINFYLEGIWIESKERDYHFNHYKFEEMDDIYPVEVTQGQIDFERIHLLKKLKIRDTEKYRELLNCTKIEIHPLFNMVEGEKEMWEKG